MIALTVIGYSLIAVGVVLAMASVYVTHRLCSDPKKKRVSGVW